MSKNDQRCTPFLQNLADLGAAIVTWGKLVSTRPGIKFLVFPPKDSGARIGHELKNTFWQEPLRKLLGRCTKND